MSDLQQLQLELRDERKARDQAKLREMRTKLDELRRRENETAAELRDERDQAELREMRTELDRLRRRENETAAELREIRDQLALRIVVNEELVSEEECAEEHDEERTVFMVEPIWKTTQIPEMTCRAVKIEVWATTQPNYASMIPDADFDGDYLDTGGYNC